MSKANRGNNAADAVKRRSYGQSRRKVLHRVDQANWVLRDQRHDPVAALLGANRGRLEHLLPIKFGRMAVSPSGFFRGAVPLMAADLATLPITGLLVQICGDAHIRNFGAYAGPDGRLIFDINDFDETIQGPWEWDVKRMAASLVVAGRDSNNSDQQCNRAVLKFVASYRHTMQELAQMPYLELARFEVQRLRQFAPVSAALHKAQRAIPQQTLQKMTTIHKSRNPVFKEDKPIVVRQSRPMFNKIVAALRAYRDTVYIEYLQFFDRYQPVDLAFKVVGTSSVGTRDYVLLCLGNGGKDPLFLQVKEELPSAYEKYLKKPPAYSNQGRRVVEGQRRMQSRCDVFLGWTKIDGRDYLVRQFRDHKASVNPQDLKGQGLLDYAQVCAELLAKGHARSGDPCAISGYCGNSDKLDRAIAKFAFAYADQTESDYHRFMAAIKRGKLRASAL